MSAVDEALSFDVGEAQTGARKRGAEDPAFLAEVLDRRGPAAGQPVGDRQSEKVDGADQCRHNARAVSRHGDARCVFSEPVRLGVRSDAKVGENRPLPISFLFQRKRRAAACPC